MNRRRCEVVPIEGIGAGPDYDLLVASLGFEDRAWYVSSRVFERSRTRLACGFTSRKIYAFERNEQRFRDAKFDVVERNEETFGAWWDGALRALVAERGRRALRICVDVSSMSRFRIATVLASVLDVDIRAQIEVDFVYAVASYSPPNLNISTAIEICAPVVSKYAGWWSEPERPAVAIFGLGYEQERAVGAWEYLEPSSVWAFAPTGEDDRYDRDVENANEHLWEMLPAERVVKYAVERPFECFQLLESLTYANLRNTRVILVPFGPKIFAVCCLLAASVHWPNVAVWRVSAGQGEPAVDRVASGKVVGIRAIVSELSVPCDSER